LIVAHGQPSAPEGAAAELRAFAGRVGALMPGRAVAAATLAEPGALAAAVAALGPGMLVYPMFMAGGWFTRVHLPQRLAEAGAAGAGMLEPFGCDPAVQDLAGIVVAEALAGEGAGGGVILAAHGSSRSPAPAEVAGAVAALVAQRLGRPVAVGFIEQAPRLEDLAGFGAGSLCLPYFAASGGHVEEDLPRALARAGFGGRILPALGLDPRVPGLVAAATGRLRRYGGRGRNRPPRRFASPAHIPPP
jgi:sirohydrochlorin ferrochelatase